MENGHTTFEQIIKYVIPYIFKLKDRGLKFRALCSFLLILITNAFSVAIPWCLRSVTGVLKFTDKPDVYQLAIIYLLLYGTVWTLQQITWQLREVLIARPFARVLKDVCVDLFKHIIGMSMRFHADRRTGAVTSAISQAQEGLPSIIMGVVYWIVPYFLEIIFASALLAWRYGMAYAFMLLALAIAFMLFVVWSSDIFMVAQTEFTKTKLEVGAQLVDSLLNIETIKYFHNQAHESEKSDKVLQRWEVAEGGFYETLEAVHLVQGIIMGLGLTFITLYSGRHVLLGYLTLSDFVLINSCVIQFIMPFMIIGKIIRDIRKSVAKMQNVMSLLFMKSEIKESKTPETLGNPECIKIEFKDVEFGYLRDLQILKGINLIMPAGTTTAIVGATGAGKSTITKLLFRFYDVAEGQILINDHDIRKLTLQELNSLIGIVPQNTVLFNDTLYYNIAYGNLGATSEDVQRAVEMAQLERFIKNLPKGLETQVGEHGIKLSGGERQRVAIARALLKRPKLFIFDEATSALDLHTERKIQENLRQISHNVTTIIIAHRLSTVVHADQIVVLEGGKVAEIGSHQQLLAANGVYAKLWQQQFSIISTESAPHIA